MNEKITKSHKDFIKRVAEGATYTDAYQAAAKNKPSRKTCEQNGSKLAKRYAKQIQSERERLQLIVTTIKDNDIVKTAINNILSVTEIDAAMSKIITDETTNASEKAKAADLLYKRQGAYAVTKVESTINTTINIPRTNWIEPNDKP